MGLTYRSTGTRLGTRLRRLSQSGKEVARAAVASTVRDLIAEGFAREVDPRGRAWAERTRFYPWPKLDKTGRMKRGFDIDTRGANIVIANSTPYARFHQSGTKNMPARRLVPVSTFSPRWLSRINATVRAALDRLK